MRYNRNTEGNIESEDFAELRECLRELQFMNQQYLLFKNKKKQMRTKTRNFYKFYENCVEKKNLIDKIKTKKNKDGLCSKEKDLLNRFQLVQKCGRVLPRKPTQVDSLLSDDFRVSSGDFSLFQNVLFLHCECPCGLVIIFWLIFN